MVGVSQFAPNHLSFPKAYVEKILTSGLSIVLIGIFRGLENFKKSVKIRRNLLRIWKFKNIKRKSA